MKKIKMSVAALLIASVGYGQNSFEKDIKAEISVYELREMIITIESILEWQDQDMEKGYTNMGSYEEGWGSNYWLTVMRDDMYKLIEKAEKKWRK